MQGSGDSINRDREFRKYGYAGWRLDASNEVPPGFWRLARQTIKKADADYLLLGEIWHDGSRMLTGDQLDSLTNYNLYFRLVDNFLLEGKAEDLQAELNFLWQNYPKEALYVMMNMMDSHDTQRQAVVKSGQLAVYVPENQALMLIKTTEPYREPLFNWEDIPLVGDYLASICG